MSRRLFTVALGAISMALCVAALPAQAEFAAAAGAQAATSKPLLIIRFNQRNVYFQRSLNIAVKKAEEAKPGVQYDVVSYVPQAGAGAATENLNAVVSTMLNMGIPQSRIQASTQAVAAGTSQEVHIFVY